MVMTKTNGQITNDLICPNHLVLIIFGKLFAYIPDLTKNQEIWNRHII